VDDPNAEYSEPSSTKVGVVVARVGKFENVAENALCQKYCIHVPLCKFWTRTPSNVCFLYKDGAARTVKQGYSSGIVTRKSNKIVMVVEKTIV